MSDQAKQQLQQAYQLIKAGRKDDAVQVLTPILRADSTNANAWWLMANAVENPEHQRKSLQKLLQLRPGDEKALKMLSRLEPGTPAAPPPRAPEPPQQTRFDDDPFADDPFAEPASAGFDDDPFADDPFADDPFAEAQTSTFAADDPFADDPFADDAPPRKRGAGSSREERLEAAKARSKKSASSSGSSNTALIVLAVVGGLALFACVGCGLAFSTGAISFATMFGEAFEEAMENITFEPSGYGAPLSSDVVQRGNIGYGQSQRATVDTFDDDAWTFTGAAGDRITIRVNETDGQLDPQLYLYDPNNSQIAENDDVDFGGGNTNSRVDITLPESGVYTIVVSAFGSGGSYELILSQN